MNASARGLPAAAPASSGSAVECRALTVSFGARRILEGVDLAVAPGERVAIMGASGAGKSTLLACLAGRLVADQGRVERAGVVSSIHQDLRLVKPATALANVLHGSLGRVSWRRSLFGFPAAERQRALGLLERVGIADRAASPVSRLSGGEQQRVAIARALMQDPVALVADEPVASLDPDNARAALSVLSELTRERRVALIVVLHDLALARHVADRVLVLRSGRLEPYMEDAPVEDRDSGGAAKLGAVTAPPPEPSAHRAWRFVAIAIAAALAYGWALRALPTDEGIASEALNGVWGFLRGLWPQPGQLRGIAWAEVAGSLSETVQMSLLGTTIGVAFSAPLAILAAANLSPALLRTPARAVLNVIRTVPSLVWALMFVAAVGFGPLAGILALSAYSIGYLAKFFYESLESVDRGASEALGELGASGLQRFFHAVFPAALPLLASSCLFMLEYNVRAASVLGIVDAGGIGWHIKHFLDYRNFPAALACLAMVLAVVIALDAISARVRVWAMRR